MKKITLLAFAFIAISFASCKKDRTCTCTTTNTPPTGSTTSFTQETTVKKAKKSDALRGKCRSFTTQETAPVARTKTDVVCELK